MTQKGNKQFEKYIGACYPKYCSQITVEIMKIIPELKADRPHPCDYSTHRQTPRTDNDSSLLFAVLGKAEPLISSAARRKLDLDLRP